MEKERIQGEKAGGKGKEKHFFNILLFFYFYFIIHFFYFQVAGQGKEMEGSRRWSRSRLGKKGKWWWRRMSFRWKRPVGKVSENILV
jgi:hypothetical protein